MEIANAPARGALCYAELFFNLQGHFQRPLGPPGILFGTGLNDDRLILMILYPGNDVLYFLPGTDLTDNAL